MKGDFPHELEKWGRFQDDSSALHLLCTLFLLLLHQLHLRPSGIRFWSLGTPAIQYMALQSSACKLSLVELNKMPLMN